MAQEKIQLRRVRTFSEALNDVIQFLKQEFKPLMRSFFLICGIFILAGGILGGFYSSGLSGIWTSIFTGNSRYVEQTSISSIYGIPYFLSIFSSLLSQSLVYTLVASYMKVYEQKNRESPTLEEVWKVLRKNILYTFFYGLLLGILITIGTIFCIAPGVYLATVFAPFAFVVVIEEDKSLGSIFSRCFLLIKENFWPSLGLYVVCGLIYYFTASFIGLIVGGITGLISYFTTNNIGFVVGMVTGIIQVFSSAFSIILYLSVGMQYFNLEERSNGTGLMSRIQNMGNDRQDDEDRSTVFIKD